MTCTQIRSALSARLDGEDAGIDEAAMHAHLATCADCRRYSHDAERLHRGIRLAPAPSIPDRAAGILAAIGADSLARDATDMDAAHDTDTRRLLSWLLVAIALVQIGVAIPALLGSDAGLPVHTARHIGSFDVALGVGFLFAAWRPSRLPGLLPVVTALVVCLAGSSLLDVISGNTAAFGEAQHVTDVAGLAVMWLLARPATRSVRLA
jgi:predicted anti-sigma-YlaC factor YlaD